MTEIEHGHAAMSPDDIDDARRRRADRSLEPWAQARGLEFHGAAHLSGYAPALPRFLEEQQQAMRGILPGGRHGILLHAVLQTHFRDQAPHSDMPGSFHRVVVKPPPGALRKALRPSRTWIPLIGGLFDDGIDDFDRPFAAHGAWAPITICATAVPETVARVPELGLRTASRLPGGRLTDVPAVGPLKVFRAAGDAGVVTADPRVRALLGELSGPYWEVRVAYGVLTVQRNGFLVEDAALDGLCRRVCALGDALAAACAPPSARPPLAEPLPAPGWLADPEGPGDPALQGGWAPDAAATAATRGLTLEEPAAWHERFGAVPVPGRAAIVLRAGEERVLLCADRPLWEVRAVRPVLVVPAPAGAAPTPPGGRGVEGARVFVEDGVAVVWALQSRGYVGEALDLVPDLRAALAAATTAGPGRAA